MFRHPSESLEPHIRRLFNTHFYPVSTGRAQPEQPREQPGRAVVPGKQARVREEGDGHRGAELGRRLRDGASPLPRVSPSTRKYNDKTKNPSHPLDLSFLPHSETANIYPLSKQKVSSATDHMHQKKNCSRARTMRKTGPRNFYVLFYFCRFDQCFPTLPGFVRNNKSRLYGGGK